MVSLVRIFDIWCHMVLNLVSETRNNFLVKHTSTQDIAEYGDAILHHSKQWSMKIQNCSGDLAGEVSKVADITNKYFQTRYYQ